MTVYLRIEPASGAIIGRVSVVGRNQPPPPGLMEAGEDFKTADKSYFDGADFLDRTPIDLEVPVFLVPGQTMALSGLPGDLFIRINGQTVSPQAGEVSMIMPAEGITLRAIGKYSSPVFNVDPVSADGEATLNHPIFTRPIGDVDDWIDTNITNLNSARGLFKVLVRAIRKS